MLSLSELDEVLDGSGSKTTRLYAFRPSEVVRLDWSTSTTSKSSSLSRSTSFESRFVQNQM